MRGRGVHQETISWSAGDEMRTRDPSPREYTPMSTHKTTSFATERARTDASPTGSPKTSGKHSSSETDVQGGADYEYIDKALAHFIETFKKGESSTTPSCEGHNWRRQSTSMHVESLIFPKINLRWFTPYHSILTTT